MPLTAEERFRYQKRWRYDRAHGRLRLVDASPARLHIAACLGADMSLRAIAAAANVSVQVVHKIHHGQATCKPATRVAILAVPIGPTEASTPDTTEAFVPRLGTVRRLQALIAIGWPHRELTLRCGHRTAVLLNQQGRWVTASTHADVARMYDEISMTPGPSAHSRGWALRLGYQPPLAWDDIDTDPGPAVFVDELSGEDVDEEEIDELAVVRACAGDPPEHMTTAERQEVVRRLHAAGLNDQEAAARSGMAAKTILRHRQILGLPAVTTSELEKSA